LGYEKRFDIPPKSFNFKNDLKYGEDGEQFIKSFYEQVIQGSAEVKTDRYRNGRMVVETQQNPQRAKNLDGSIKWKNSGINVTTADWWLYVYSLNESFVVVSVKRLKSYLRKNKDRFTESAKVVFAENSDNPAKGFLLEPNEVMDMIYNKDYDS